MGVTVARKQTKWHSISMDNVATMMPIRSDTRAHYDAREYIATVVVRPHNVF